MLEEVLDARGVRVGEGEGGGEGGRGGVKENKGEVLWLIFIYINVNVFWCVLQQALRGAVRLEGDVITADGEILRGVSKGTRLPADPREILQGKSSFCLIQ